MTLLATYVELKAKGVKFKKEPTKEFYGLKYCSNTILEIGFHLEKREEVI